MNIREPREFRTINSKRPRRKPSKILRRLLLLLIILVVAAVPLTYVAYARALPALQTNNVLPSQTAEAAALPWPANSYASVGTLSGGVLASTSGQKPTPTASVAKVMMALSVLKQKPLKAGEQGPIITISASDVALYKQYVAKGGSVLPVTEGEQLTEYQALQAALLPSANNIADLLAVWAFGSLQEYFAFANNLAGTLDMTQSKFGGDASGFMPDTVSTPDDLIRLGQAALQNPVIKQIVSLKTAELPGVGIVYSTNYLLGRDGIIGIKTGNTDEAGGNYLFASERTLPNGTALTVIGAIMHAPDLIHAINGAPALLDATFNNFAPYTVVHKGDKVTQYSASWLTSPIYAVADKDIVIYGWKGKAPDVSIDHSSISLPASTASKAGTITANTVLGTESTGLSLDQPINLPTWQWRLLRKI